jgi:hypothetical protein
MTTFLTVLCCLLLAGDDPARTRQERKPSAIAPSLPALTEEEEDRLDGIVDRFIQQDIGRLKGAEAKKALADFNKLGPEAIPALIRGINRAAAIEDSCPALVIAKKLYNLLSKSTDPELLQFARENIGAGIRQSRHLGTLQELRLFCAQRRSLVARQIATGALPARSLKTMSVEDLASAAGSERGQKLKMVLVELEKRNGDEAVSALGSAAAASYEQDIQKLARDLLVRNLSRQKEAVIKEKLKNDRAEVRSAAARVAGERKLRLGGELINLLTDDTPAVREAAHQALVRLNKGADLGPKSAASEKDRSEAVRRWREWWSAQDGK